MCMHDAWQIDVVGVNVRYNDWVGTVPPTSLIIVVVVCGAGGWCCAPVPSSVATSVRCGGALCSTITKEYMNGSNHAAHNHKWYFVSQPQQCLWIASQVHYHTWLHTYKFHRQLDSRLCMLLTTDLTRLGRWLADLCSKRASRMGMLPSPHVRVV
jgi:hypothetical protein